MRDHLLGTALIAVMISTSANLHAAASYTLETAIFVFKDSEVRTVEIPGATTAGEAGSLVFRSPASARFGDGTLSLAGSDYSWGAGINPPASLSRIDTPAVSLQPDKPVALLFSAPVQYLEKAADGNLQVREIPVESPDAPHWRLTFKLASEEAGDGGLLLSCDVDIASVSARESLPGVTLPVGKPVLSRFNEKLRLQVSTEEWSAFVVRGPNGSDYTMLTLLKIRPGKAPAESAGLDRPMTAQEFAVFATYYYRNPQPERIAHAIESLGSNRFLDKRDNRYPVQYFQRVQTTVGFFTEVFAANPERVTEWRKLIDQKGQRPEVRNWLNTALKLSQTRATHELAPSEVDWAKDNFLSWGAFLASGDPAYLRQMVGRFELVHDSEFEVYVVGADAMGLLAFHAPHHPLVRLTLVVAREDASPRTRELIDDILTNDYEAVRRKIIRDLTPRWPSDLWPNSLNSFPQGIPPPPPPKFP